MADEPKTVEEEIAQKNRISYEKPERVSERLAHELAHHYGGGAWVGQMKKNADRLGSWAAELLAAEREAKNLQSNQRYQLQRELDRVSDRMRWIDRLMELGEVDLGIVLALGDLIMRAQRALGWPVKDLP